MSKSSEYNSAQNSGSVVDKISTAHQKYIQENGEYIKCLIDICLYFGRQGISFCGHHENDESLNKGNFKEMCSLLAKYNPEFSKKFENNLTNHTSWLIQNELIFLCALKVKKTIINEIKDSGMFSIQCDEARYHQEEQLAITIRYPKKLDVCERFIGFVNVSKKQNADAIVTALLNFINTSDLSQIPIIGQSYDGAVVLSGSECGVPIKLRQNHLPASVAIYIYSLAHKLDLVIVNMCKHFKGARNVFNGLQAMCVHFSYPTTNTKLIEIQEKLDLKKTKIGQLSDTQWICQLKSCDTVLNDFKAIECILTEEIEVQESKNMAQAIGILATIKNFKFVLHLFILRELLKIVNILSVQLEAKSATLGKSSNLINNIINTLEKNRWSGHFFNELWDNIITFCNDNNICTNTSTTRQFKRSRKEPTYLQDFDISTVTGAGDNLIGIKDVKSYWKKNAFFPIMDAIIINMKKRFPAESIQMATSVDNLMKMDFEGSSFLIDHYKDVLKITTKDLQREMCMFRIFFSGNLEYVYFKKRLTQQGFPNLFKLIQVAVTLPVSSSTCERSFSTMQRINTYLSSTMCEDRFSELSVLNIEKDIVVNVEDIFNEFSKTESKIKLM